jgi:molybdate transport system regulatory protein
MPTPSSKPPASKPVVRFRMRVTAGETIAIGPGKIRLLEAIEETGSLTAAAKSLDMSYRRAWVLINQLNASLKKPAVESAKGGEHGGGSQVTVVGRQLIESYRTIEATAEASCKADIQTIVRLLAAPPA